MARRPDRRRRSRAAVPGVPPPLSKPLAPALRASTPGWWDRVRAHSLGWVGARDPGGALVGFVNVAWDGGLHAFVLDTEVDPAHRRRGVATELVALAARQAREAGCEWLHVDFEEHLRPFYLDACGFRPTDAGLVHLLSVR